MTIKLKRVYDAPASGDRYRILVDRIWPRGVSRQAASVSLWLKTAPSTELRKWYGHIPERWPEFKRRYLQELSSKYDEVETVRGQIKNTRNGMLLWSIRQRMQSTTRRSSCWNIFLNVTLSSLKLTVAHNVADLSRVNYIAPKLGAL